MLTLKFNNTPFFEIWCQAATQLKPFYKYGNVLKCYPLPTQEEQGVVTEYNIINSVQS